MLNNKIRIIGHVGHNPERTTYDDTGNKRVKFSVGVNEYSANKEKETLWFDVVCWNGLADRAEQIITRGREVVVEGRLALSSYEKQSDEGTIKVTKPYIKMSDFHCCGPKPKDEDQGADVEEPMEDEEESSPLLTLV